MTDLWWTRVYFPEAARLPQPVLIHRHVDSQLKKQLNEENALTKCLQSRSVLNHC